METIKEKTRYTLSTNSKKLLADTFTPVSVYLKLRDKYPGALLLESSDYHGNENSYSFICLKPLASFKAEQDTITESYPDKNTHTHKINNNVKERLQKFASAFDIDSGGYKLPHNGLFGYITYDSVKYFENINLEAKQKNEKNIPDVFYSLYQFVIVVDHFKDELYLFEHLYKNQESELEQLESLIKNKDFASYRFQTEGDERSNVSDDEFKNMVHKGKEHCHRGDVFQIVLSREFSRQFKGDEFNVYRALRSVNPSPYLFYFDYGNFKLFGSSPEAQLVISNREASIHPIAGTFKRTGDDAADAAAAEKLKSDKKENAEHVMLVDLARNDLSRNCSNVQVNTFKEMQFYSHVIHLVSNVGGTLKPGVETMNVVADTFPAGTLSGAPKHKAMQLINKYENVQRSFYGGCIGFMGFNGDFNHAIMIRSFLSKNNRLFYQAGAGVVESSVEESELNEVNNKLAALKKAIQLAETI